MSAETTQTQERTIDQVRQELREAQQAEQCLQVEKAELEGQRQAASDTDDGALIEAALSGKRLPKNSRFRQALDRLQELPALQHAIRTRILQLQIEVSELERLQLEEERTETSQRFYELEEQFQQLREERDMAQSLASGAAEDVRTKVRSINALRNQLAQHEQSKVSSDPIEAELARRKVWRGP